MTADDLNSEAIRQIGDGNLVAPCEALKSQLLRVVERLDRMDRGEQRPDLRTRAHVDNAIDGMRDELAGFLAVAFPLIEYGGDQGQEAVVTALSELAREVRMSQTSGWEEAVRVIVARLVWATGAFALSCDEIGFLQSLLRVATTSTYDRRTRVSVVDDSSARYLAVYSGDAGITFDAHAAWLGELDFLAERYPLLARSERFIDAMREADLLFALHAIAEDSTLQPYSHGAQQPGQPAEERLRSRVRDPRQRDTLADLFGTDAPSLETRLQDLYSGLRANANVFASDRVLF